jgi:hypothetical protein
MPVAILSMAVAAEVLAAPTEPTRWTFKTAALAVAALLGPRQLEAGQPAGLVLTHWAMQAMARAAPTETPIAMVTAAAEGARTDSITSLRARQSTVATVATVVFQAAQREAGAM